MMEAIECNDLRSQVKLFKQLVSAVVVSAAFNVYGDPDWPNGGNTVLHLELMLKDGNTVYKAFCFDRSGTHILPINRSMPNCIKYVEIPRAIQIWREWFEDKSINEPLKTFTFTLVDSPEYNWMIGDTISAFHLICDANYLDQIGLVMEFKSGNHLSIKGIEDGCVIRNGAHYDEVIRTVLVVVNESSV